MLKIEFSIPNALIYVSLSSTVTELQACEDLKKKKSKKLIKLNILVDFFGN